MQWKKNESKWKKLVNFIYFMEKGIAFINIDNEHGTPAPAATRVAE